MTIASLPNPTSPAPSSSRTTASPSRDSAASLVAELVSDESRFKSNFLRAATMGLGGIGLVVTPLTLAGPNPVSGLITCMLAVIACAIGFFLTRQGHNTIAARVFLYGIVGAMIISLAQEQRPESIPLDGSIFLVLLVLAAFLLERLDTVLIASIGSLGILIVLFRDTPRALLTSSDRLTSPVIAVLFLGLTEICASLFVRNARELQTRLHRHVTDIERVMARAERIAAGDLSGDVEGDTQVSQTVRAMLTSLRETVLRVRESANGLAAATQEIAAMARQQEAGAVEQATAVIEIRTTLTALLEASNRVAENSQDVFRNVEHTQTTSDKIAERITTLSNHTRRITAILDIIKGIANKSEILALNASLEGARAGEAGRGFSLVASQMQRLAENVMDSLADVRALTDDIEQATNATVIATEEGTKLAARATVGARQISVTAQQQRSSTEQVSAAMQDIGEVAKQVSAGSTQTLAATRDLTALAEGLQKSIESFRL